MRSFNHITLDFENVNHTQLTQYWATSFIHQTNQTSLTENIDIYKKFLRNPYQNQNAKILLKSTQLTLDLNTENVNRQLSTNSLYNLDVLLNHDSFKSYAGSALPSWYNLINVNFLRKERMYTKLKYSRSPAYDTVSGGAAALFAGFLGFLVSEKFGMELVDSGDFYFLIMYTVFLCFSIRPLLTVLNPTAPLSDAFSLKGVLLLYTNLLSLFIKRFK